MQQVKPWIAAQPNESRVAAQVGGDAMLAALMAAMSAFPAPVPLALTHTRIYKGGLIPASAGDESNYSRDLRRATAPPSRASIGYAMRGRPTAPIAGGAFASFSALIAAASGGKGQHLLFTKAGTAGIAGRSNTLWNVGAVPAAGGVGGTTGTGVAKTRTSTGALTQANPASANTNHVIGGTFQGSVGTQMLLVYDRLWDMTHTMTVDPRSCDAANPPTRYQTAALAPANFLSGEVTTVLPAASPTVTFDYVDQDGNNVTGPALSTIYSAAAVNTVPFTAPNWFYPLASTDTGLRSLQNSANAVNLSAAMASGVVTWFIGHPLLLIPIPAANVPVLIDGINSALNLSTIYDNACIALMELSKGATTATNWWGDLLICAE